MIGEVEGVAAFHAEKIVVDAALVTIVTAHDLHACVSAAHAQRGLAAIRAVSAGGANMVHFPRTCFVTISSRCERAYRANVNAHAALFALKMVFFIGGDDRTDAAVLDS